MLIFHKFFFQSLTCVPHLTDLLRSAYQIASNEIVHPELPSTLDNFNKLCKTKFWLLNYKAITQMLKVLQRNGCLNWKDYNGTPENLYFLFFKRQNCLYWTFCWGFYKVKIEQLTFYNCFQICKTFVSYFKNILVN